MNDENIKNQINDLLMSDETTKLFIRSLNHWVKEHELYGEYFQRLYMDERSFKEMLWELADEEHQGGS